MASDHAGFEMKNALRDFLVSQDYTVEDLGPSSYEEGDDYPQLIMPVGIHIAEKPEKYIGIILGSSGQGEAIVANRFPGVRTTVYYGKNLEIIRLGRKHNDSNVLSLGAHFLTIDEAKEAVTLWLNTPFSMEERHERRIEMIDNIS